MSDLLESELRAAFAARLETLSPEREVRLRAFDYRSRTRRRRRVWAAMGTGGTALAGGAVATLVMLSSGASVAEGWTPAPSVPSAAAVTAATAACNWLSGSNGPALTGKPVLTDGRGSYTAAIYVNGNAAQICISNGQHAGTSIATNDRILGFETAPSADQLGDPSGGGGRAPGFPGAGQEEDVQGLAGSDVTAVTFTFADGSAVDATVQNGWYFAWWPGDGWPNSVKVTTGSTTTTSPMSVAACHSQASGCVFAGNLHQTQP
jgi:hypothetical protein